MSLDTAVAALHAAALKVQEDFSFGGNPDERAYGLEYAGHLQGNWPWIYADFRIIGAAQLDDLVRVGRCLEASAPAVSYLGAEVGSGGIRYRLFYRETTAL